MKKFLSILLLAGSLALAGCGSSNDDFVGGFQPPVAVTPGYFVNSATGNDATGDFATGRRFATIQAALAAAPAGSDIIVEPGNYSGAITNMENGDRLLGNESALLGGTTTTRPILTGPIVLADGNTVDFVRIQGTAGDAIDGSGRNNGTITNCEIANLTGTGNGFFGNAAKGNWIVSSNNFSNLTGAAIGFQITNADILTLIARANVIDTTLGGFSLVSSNTSQVKASITGNTIANSTLQGLELICGDNSTFCLDLEHNTNDGRYSLFEDNLPSVLSVEELANLTVAQPGGAGNTGGVDLNPGVFTNPPTPVADGFCGF